MNDMMNPSRGIHVYWVVKNPRDGSYLTNFAVTRTGPALSPTFVGPWPLKVQSHRFGGKRMEARANPNGLGSEILRVYEEKYIATFTSLRAARAHAHEYGAKVFRVTSYLKDLTRKG